MCLRSQIASLRGYNIFLSYALSILLNLALLTSRRAFPFFAVSRISLPICSPSRSQSVQMHKALQYLACDWMLSAIALLSCDEDQPAQASLSSMPHFVDGCYHRSAEQAIWRRIVPFLEVRGEVHASEMPQDRSHGDLALAPSRAKVVVKHVVFRVLVSRIELRGHQPSVSSWLCTKLTV